MKIFLLLTVIGFSAFCSASTVEWNSIIVEKYSEEMYITSWPPLYMSGIQDSDCLWLSGHVSNNLTYGSFWVEVYAGDVITGQALAETEYLFFAYAGQSSDGQAIEFSDYPIELKKGASTYLAVVLDIGHEGREFWSGWVELTLDENGDVVALSSAFDWSGGPLIVGAVPEPTSGLLLLLGISILSLRRRT
jgi:hypothetical protein